jgi:phosphate acetyltransferase
MAATIGKLIEPVLVGPESRILDIASKLHFDLTKVELVNTPHSHAAAAQGVALARAGAVSALMKGSLHTDELMAEVVRSDTGVRTVRRISHVFVMDVPTYPKPLFITDAAVNLFPTLEDKVDIVQNAIDLTRALGLKMPKVAILSAVETITSKIPSTIDAAALCKMAERGQITGALLDGPLALDNAISQEAAVAKSIRSAVAGDADILLVPTLEAGNMLVKELTFLANADAAGIVLGAQVPIILTSRADSVRARLASCAVVALYARHKYVQALIPTVDDGMITIEGERKQQREDKNEKLHRIESFHGHFTRSFSLPESVDETAIRCESKDGVLTVHIPKVQTPKAQPKQIKVE